MEKYKLFGLTGAEELAKRIVESQNINFDVSKPHLKYCESIIKKRFANQEIEIEFTESIRNDTVILVSCGNGNPNDTLIEHLIAADALKRSQVKELISIYLPLPYARQEKRGENRTSISSKLVSDMISLAGIDKLISLDIHNIAIEGMFSRNTPIFNIQPTEIFVPFIRENFTNNYVLCSPDIGFLKKMLKFKSQLGGDNRDLAILNKIRLKANEIDSISLIAGDVKDRDVLIIDDIIDTYTTIHKGSQVLKQLGAKSITVMASHGIFSNNAVELINNSEYVDKVYVTDSINFKQESDKIIILDSSKIVYNSLMKVLS